MSKEVVHLLEPVEIEAKHGERVPPGELRFDFLIQSLVEAAAVRQPGERVVVGQEPDMLLRLIAGPQIPDRNGVMDLSGKIDRTKDELDRRYGTIGTAQLGLDRPVRPPDQLGSRDRVGEAGLELGTDQFVDCRAREGPEAVVHGDDRLAVTDQKPLHRGVGQAAHAVGFQFPAAAIADVDRQACESKKNDGKARHGHGNRQPADGERRRRNCDRGIGNYRDGSHRREMVAANRNGEQQRTTDLPFQ